VCPSTRGHMFTHERAYSQVQICARTSSHFFAPLARLLVLTCAHVLTRRAGMNRSIQTLPFSLRWIAKKIAAALTAAGRPQEEVRPIVAVAIVSHTVVRARMHASTRAHTHIHTHTYTHIHTHTHTHTQRTGLGGSRQRISPAVHRPISYKPGTGWYPNRHAHLNHRSAEPRHHQSHPSRHQQRKFPA
jgi:hypothetical protein